MLIPPDPGDAAALAAAVASGDRQPRVRVLADWDRDGNYAHILSDLTSWISEWSTDRTATGDLPEEATTVEGYMAGELTLTLAGEHDTGSHVMDVFGPYRAGSPLALTPLMGVPIVVDAGFAGTVWTRVFTGQIRTISPNSSDRTVTVAALDPADLLRAHITLPAAGMDHTRWLTLDHRFWINTQWVVDHILRANGIYASPPPGPGVNVQILATAHGSHAAEIGRSSAPGDVGGLPASPIPAGDTSWWVPGPPQFGGALAARGAYNDVHGAGFAYWASDGGYQLAPGHGVGMAAWVKTGTDMPTDTGDAFKFLFAFEPMIGAFDDIRLMMAIRASDGGLSARVYVNGSFVDGATRSQSDTDGWRYYGLHWEHRADGTTLISYRMDGSTQFFTVDTPAPTTSYAPRARLFGFTPVPWCDLQVWYAPQRPAGDWPGETHTSQATLGRGLNELAYMPDVANAESLDLLTEAVQSEYALAGFDESGHFEFRPRTTIDPSSVDLEITVDGSLLDLATTSSVDTVRNAVGITATDGYFTFAASIVRSDDDREFESGTGVTEHAVTLTGEVMAAPTLDVPHILEANLLDDELYLHGFVAVRADSPSTELPPGSGISVTFAATGPRAGVVTVRNFSAHPCRFATTSGRPAMRVQGYQLVTRPPVVEQVTSQGSVDLHGERVLPLDDTGWRQRPEPLREVAGGLLATLSNPLPVLRQVPILGDPRVQIGDVIRLRDPRGQGEFRAYVVGVAHSMAVGGGFVTDLTVRPVAPPGLGLLDDTELGILDGTLVLAS